MIKCKKIEIDCGVIQKHYQYNTIIDVFSENKV